MRAAPVDNSVDNFVIISLSKLTPKCPWSVLGYR
jgi:hypothetical protein